MTKYIAIFEVEDDWNIQTIDADVTYTYESNGTYYEMREGIEFEKEKTGRWISFGIQGEIDGQIVRAFTCSKCGAISIFRVSNGNIVNGDLCPNCGAKMQEVENDA